jgi:site-specific DNA-methyltransferase (adenine-specific)
MNLILGDCRTELKQLIKDNIMVDLIVTSPPYDTIRNYDESLVWDFSVFKEVADLLYEILVDGGVLVWVVNDRTVDGSETGTSFKQALYFKEIGFNLHDTMIYQKNSMSFPTFNRYYPIFEYMFVLSKGKPKTVNLLCDRRNKQAGDKVTGTCRQDGNNLKTLNGETKGKRVKEYGVRFNIWKYDTGYGKTAKEKYIFEHPAVFPLELATDHILSWSKSNDLVLDPFMGSGTVGVACTNTNRNFIGIEKVPKYYKIAERRIKENTEQTKLI